MSAPDFGPYFTEGPATPSAPLSTHSPTPDLESVSSDISVSISLEEFQTPEFSSSQATSNLWNVIPSSLAPQAKMEAKEKPQES